MNIKKPASFKYKEMSTKGRRTQQKIILLSRNWFVQDEEWIGLSKLQDKKAVNKIKSSRYFKYTTTCYL